LNSTIVFPALDESVSEGTITRWLERVGDTVEVGEPLVELLTDKVDTEVVSTTSGVILSQLVDEDKTVNVGTSIATVSRTASDPAVDGALAVPPSPRAVDAESAALSVARC